MAANDDSILTLEAIDEIADWGEDSFAPKSAATQSTSGLMSAADKARLDGMEDGAQAHRAPTASEITGALGYIPISAAQKGAAGGVAELDAGGTVPSTQLPSYVDDVLEYDNLAEFPATGEAGKIYVALDTNKTYRWSGSAYVTIGSDLALGETSSTAYRGDRGAAAYEHAVTNKGAAFESGFYKMATNADGHVTSADAVTKSDITALGIPAQDTTYKNATQSRDGLMSAQDKTNLDNLVASGGGTTVGPVTGLTITPKNKKVQLKWSDPDETTFTGGKFGVWAGTVVVRKAGSTPVSTTDGTIVAASTTHNQYAETAFEDTGLANGTTYYYAVYAFSADGNASTPVTGEATPAYVAPTWADATDAELQEALDLHYAGDIDLTKIWKVGDTRKVQLSAMAATGVGESHVAQEVELVLMSAEHYDLTSTQKTELGTSKTKAAFVWGLKNFLANGTNGEWGYMNSSDTNANGWNGSARRTWCNGVFKAALPSTFQGLVKQVNVVTANGSSTGITTSEDYCFLAAEKEIFGSTTYANSTAESTLTQYEWYATAANRVKKAGASGSAYSWWERSPCSGYSSYFCLVITDGTAYYYNASNGNGVAPCGCV